MNAAFAALASAAHWAVAIGVAAGVAVLTLYAAACALTAFVGFWAERHAHQHDGENDRG